jgi:hypothetical protein
MNEINKDVEWGPFLGDLSGCYWQNDECYLRANSDDEYFPPIEDVKEEN